MRKRIIVAALIGLTLDGISGILFLTNDTTLSLQFMLSIFILFLGLLMSIVAFFFCLFLAARPPSTRDTERPPMHANFVPRTNARRGINPLLWPLFILLVLAVIWKIAPNLVAPPANPTQFGALVAFILLIFPLIALLYGIFSRDKTTHKA
ncbi:MAG TPA: hypothetical protein VH593_22165 [Ktedonobacteraceae bacterium]